jgi:hypothetical protein
MANLGIPSLINVTGQGWSCQRLSLIGSGFEPFCYGGFTSES